MEPLFYLFKNERQIEEICLIYYKKFLKQCVENLLAESSGEFAVRGDQTCLEREDRTMAVGMNRGSIDWEVVVKKTMDFFSKIYRDDISHSSAAHKALKFAARTLVLNYYADNTSPAGDKPSIVAVAYDYFIWHHALADSDVMLDALVAQTKIYALFVRIL